MVKLSKDNHKINFVKKKEKENETMKKKMQKYLSGSNEGFSLVELIIVIAIMAILVGVVALAVIPNLERSRESKDLTTLDNVAAALATSIANAGASASSSDTFAVSAVTSADTDPVKAGLYENLGDCSGIQMVSGAGKGSTVKAEYDVTQNKLKVWADGAQACKYQKDDKGQARKLEVVK